MDLKTEPMVWVKDNAGNRFLCHLEALRDPNSVSEEVKQNSVDDASKLENLKSVPGLEKSNSPNRRSKIQMNPFQSGFSRAIFPDSSLHRCIILE
jgi:hypothetical protein